MQQGPGVCRGDAEGIGRLPGGESYVYTQLDHLAANGREGRDHFRNSANICFSWIKPSGVRLGALTSNRGTSRRRS